MGLRINHNLASLGASLNLGRANSALSSSLAKLSTGLKINTASDGPADLIISEKFRSQINAISKATENTQNAISMLSTAEGALAEVNSLLTKMQGLALKASQTGTQSPDEIAASQAEIDAALESINSISRNTAFGSVNLLDGSQDVETTSVDTSKILVDIDKANYAGTSQDFTATVKTAAARASSTLATGTSLSTNQVLKITGNRGSSTIAFAANSSIDSIVTELNGQVRQTGVVATKDGAGTSIVLESSEYGASEFVTVEDVDGTNDILTTSAASNGISLGSAYYGVADTITKFDIKTASTTYQDYSFDVTVSAAASAAVDVNIDTTSETITVIAQSGLSNGDIVTALDAATAGGTFASEASTDILVAGTYVAEPASTGPGLTISVNEGVTVPGGGFQIIVEDSGAATNDIFFSNSDTITIQVGTAGIANDAALELIILSSAQAADLKALFSFDQTAALTSAADTVAATAFAAGSNTSTNYVKANGTDGILEVNGVRAAANNLTFTFDNGNVRGNITIDDGFNVANQESTFTISGKGAFLQIGSKAQLSHQIGVGIKSVAADQLGVGLYLNSNVSTSSTSINDDDTLKTVATLGDITSGGNFDLATDAQTAYDIISNAITEVAVSRSKLGALISNTLESNINSLGVSFENLTAAESRIRDVDFAAETAEFTRAQILVQAGTSVAAQANVATQAALQLLG
jgi:flagellin